MKSQHYFLRNLRPAFENSADPALRSCSGHLSPNAPVFPVPTPVHRVVYRCGQKCLWPQDKEEYLALEKEEAEERRAAKASKAAAPKGGRPRKVQFCSYHSILHTLRVIFCHPQGVPLKEKKKKRSWKDSLCKCKLVVSHSTL